MPLDLTLHFASMTLPTTETKGHLRWRSCRVANKNCDNPEYEDRKFPRNFGRLRLKCDGTCAENRFRLSGNGRVHVNRQRASVQSTTDSWDVRISGSNAWHTMFRGSVKSTGYPLHSLVSPSLPPRASLRTAGRSQPVYCAAVYREWRYQMLCEYNFSSWRWAC